MTRTLVGDMRRTTSALRRGVISEKRLVCPECRSRVELQQGELFCTEHPYDCGWHGKSLPREGGAMPKRIQLSRRRGFKKPPGAVVVSRPSKFGNPYRVERVGKLWLVGKYAWSDRAQAVRFAVRAFRNDLIASRLAVTVDDVRRELRGKDLCCWCKPEDACHADVLIEIADRGCS